MPGLPALMLLGLGGLEEVRAQLSLCQQEGMLRDLQKSVEEEEQVWKAKLTASEEELQKVRVWGPPGFVARGAACAGAEGLLAVNGMVTLTVPDDLELLRHRGFLFPNPPLLSPNQQTRSPAKPLFLLDPTSLPGVCLDPASGAGGMVVAPRFRHGSWETTSPLQ